MEGGKKLIGFPGINPPPFNFIFRCTLGISMQEGNGKWGLFCQREREREIRAAEISPLGIKALLRTLWNFEKFTARYDED